MQNERRVASKLKKIAGPAAMAVMAVLANTRSADANSYTFNGSAATWGTGSAWTPTGGPPVSGDSATLDDTATTNLAISGSGALKDLTFNSLASSYTISATLTLDAGGSVTVANTDTVNQVISGATTWLGSGSITNNSTTALLTIGANNLPTTGGFSLTLGGSGNITTTAAFGSTNGSIVKTGNGTLTLANASNSGVTGGFVLNGGTVINIKNNGMGSKQLTLGGATLQENLSNGADTWTGVAVTASSTIFYNNTSNTYSIGLTTGLSQLTSPNNNAPTLTLKTGTGGSIVSYLNATGFAGSFAIADNSVFRLRPNGGTTSAAAGAILSTYTLGAASKLELQTPIASTTGAVVSTNLGSLSSSQTTAIIRGAFSTSGGSQGVQYSIGALNTDTTYAGTIQEGAAATAINITNGSPTTGDQGITALEKVGSGTLKLSNTANTYRGGTIIRNGTLEIAGDGSLGALYTGAVMAFTYTGGSGTTVPFGSAVQISAPNVAGGTQATGVVSGGNGGYWTVNNQGSGYLYDPTVTITGTTPAVLGTARVIGLLTFDGGTLKTDAGISSSRAVVLTSNGGTIDTNGFDSTFSGVFTNGSGNTGGLAKSGAGTLTLTNAETYLGATTVTAGTLALNNASLASGNVTVKAAGAFAMNAGSGIKMNITPGTSADAFTSELGSTVTLDGTLTLNFASAVSTDPQQWTLFSLGSGTATGFDAINLTGTYTGSLSQLGGGLWETTINDTVFDFTESSGALLTHTPEPASLSLVMLAGTGLLARRRRKA